MKIVSRKKIFNKAFIGNWLLNKDTDNLFKKIYLEKSNFRYPSLHDLIQFHINLNI